MRIACITPGSSLIMITPQSRRSALYLCLLFALANAETEQPNECDEVSCDGPFTEFYKELKCKPVFGYSDIKLSSKEFAAKCCPSNYNCSHLSNRDPSKHCYANGHEYAFGEHLRDKDNLFPYSKDCKCEKSGEFSCTPFTMKYPELPRPDCYYRYPVEDHSVSVVCPKKGEERAKCVNGVETYLDGEVFQPIQSPQLRCICLPGFTGSLEKPFCSEIKCQYEKIGYPYIHKKCAPRFKKIDHSHPFTCPTSFKCENEDDEIIPKIEDMTYGPPIAYDYLTDNLKCEYGKRLLNLNTVVLYRDVPNNLCVFCHCRIPPFLICIEMSIFECDRLSNNTVTSNNIFS